MNPFGGATPCPGPKSSRLDLGDSSADIWEDGFDAYDDTAGIDFTTEIRAPVLRGAKPRRGRTTTFKIHEDGKDETLATADGGTKDTAVKRKIIDRKSTMLAQPAQRFRPKVSFAVSPSHGPSRAKTETEAKASKAESITRQERPSLRQENQNVDGSPKKDVLKKDVRRNTVYIPPDDTTVASVFMGLFSPIKNQKLNGVEPIFPDDTQIDSLEAQIARKRLARKSLTVAPRRAPLQQSSKVTQGSTIKRDIAGQNGGKENIPPGGLLIGHKDKDCKAELPVFELPVKSKPKTVERPQPSTAAKAQSLSTLSSGNTEKKRSGAKTTGRISPKKTVLGVRQNNASSLTLKSGVKKSSAATAKNSSRRSPSQISRSSALSSLSVGARSQVALSKLTIPNVKVNIEQKYPLLTEDISNPAMYEDNWLAHQEIAITQLVNCLFDSACGNLDLDDPDTLRHDLLEIYLENPFTLLHKRLQASLLYGALGIPKDVLARGSRLKEDLGLRRKFLDFWVQTYDLSALRAAAETVVGRRMSVPLRPSASGSGASPNQSAQRQEKMLKRTLEAFLDTFLLRNEDRDQSTAELKAGDTSVAGWEYRRTVFRCILMIVLLDKARLSPESSLPRRLFISSSPYKSSGAVLQALGNMLLPSVGDISRALGHMDCQVSYIQHPLQEYEFRINNLAVDLRDGVLLTRLVELLLYPSASRIISRQHDPDASTTVAMPTGEVLPLLQGENDWPLSQHLKLPCIGRVTKVFNVQIALSALLGVKGVGVIARDVHAEDIVDGYREKTIALLWGLVGKWGLGGLVDWDDVRKEISRLKRKMNCELGDVQEEEDEMSECEEDIEEGYERHAFLLKKWASILAHLKGLRLDNLTTSFADGKIFEAIVDEYEAYIIGQKRKDSAVSDHADERATIRKPTRIALGSRLRALGCSSQFANLVSPATPASSRIFDRDFTLASLAFLCSRLLSASKRTRAAVVLQSAWRHTLARRTLHHRILARSVARQCAAVVQTRDRILWAKNVIVNWWRREKARAVRRNARSRIGRLKPQPAKATSKPNLKSAMRAVAPKQQTFGFKNNNSILQKQRDKSTGVMFEKPMDKDKDKEAQNDLWLSL